MVKWLFISAVCWIVLGGGFTVWAFLKFDSLLKQMHANNHAEWVKLGKPRGYFWIPKELKGLFRRTFDGSGLASFALLKSASDSSTSQFSTLSAANYGAFRMAIMLGRISFVAGLVCLVLTLVCIFL